jgi:hypothetical protein
MRSWRLSTSWLLAAAAALVACGTPTGQDPSPSLPTSTSTATTAAAPTTVAGLARSDFPTSGSVEPGNYHIDPSAWSVAGLTMTMPGGWETQYGSPGAIKHSDQLGELSFYFVIVDAIYADPCLGPAGGAVALLEVGPSVDDLANALLEQPHTVATGPVDTTLGGLPAKRIDLTMGGDPETETCNINLPGHLQIWYSPPADKYFVLLGDGTASVYIVEINSERQVMLTQHREATTAEDLAEMQTILESITIDT